MRQPDILDRLGATLVRLAPYLVLAVLFLAVVGICTAQDMMRVVRGGWRREAAAPAGPTNIPQFASSITWYRFNEFTNSAGKHVDSSAVGTNTAVPAASGAMPTWVSASEGLYFGGGDYSYQNSSYPLHGLSEVTYSVWISNTIYKGYAGILLSTSTSLNGLTLYDAPDNELFAYYSTNANKYTGDLYSYSTTITNAGWLHVCMCIATNDFTFTWYVNGILVRTDVDTKLKDKIYQVTALFIGMQEGVTARSFYGNIDDVLIYNKKLSSNEVWQLYQFGH